MKILGISAFYHDSAAALIEDEVIVAAASEERFTRIKGDSSFPANAVEFCLKEAGITIDEIDEIVFYENPFLKFSRILTISHAVAPFGLTQFVKAIGKWITKDLWIDSDLRKRLSFKDRTIRYCEHHLSHAASAFYPSPFDSAAILVIDGVGEWASVSIAKGSGNGIDIVKEIRFPHSFGLLYSAFTYYLGFKINSGEYKVMGLAPYGSPRYSEIIEENILKINEDGSVYLNQEYFCYTKKLKTINGKFEKLLGRKSRLESENIEQFHMDVAASIQHLCNKVVLGLAHQAKKVTGESNLCLAGGVALNVVSVGELRKATLFSDIWVQPAAGDAGGALGCAQWAYYSHHGNTRKALKEDSMKSSLLGPEIAPSSAEADEMLRKHNAHWKSYTTDNLMKFIASTISQGKTLALARGPMEWGPRALGCRSILADARSASTQKSLNLQVKYRESFRPFAPIVLEEDASQYFDIDGTSPYMLSTFPIKDDQKLPLRPEERHVGGFDALNIQTSKIPAVTHVDYSARVQTVSKQKFPFMYGVLSHFREITGCSLLVNTSFNIRGEPIVCTEEDALKSFIASQLDYVVIGNRVLARQEQPESLLGKQEEWKNRFLVD